MVILIIVVAIVGYLYVKGGKNPTSTKPEPRRNNYGNIDNTSNQIENNWWGG